MDANGKLGTWQYAYTRDVPDEYFDCVYLPQRVQHSEDWKVSAPKLLRVMKSGRRIVLAEIGFGPDYHARIEADLHIWATFNRIWAGARRAPDDLSYWSPAQLGEAFQDVAIEPGSLEWKGLEIFWARKP